MEYFLHEILTKSVPRYVLFIEENDKIWDGSYLYLSFLVIATAVFGYLELI
jgi:hypothetical protein